MCNYAPFALGYNRDNVKEMEKYIRVGVMKRSDKRTGDADMITAKEIADKTMTPEKRALAHNDYFAFYVGRPMSYVLTIPFLYTSISPNTISLISIIPLIVGFLVSCFAKSRLTGVVCWFLFFLWNLLDGVDGNVARYKKQFSKYGSVYDAMAGYAAAALTFMSMGIMGAHMGSNMLAGTVFRGEVIMILGSLSALVNIFPRLIMHKAISTLMDKKAVSGVKEKQNFGHLKTFALNLRSVAGGGQVLMLVAILTGCMDIFTMFYFLFNSAVMVMSLRSIFKEK